MWIAEVVDAHAQHREHVRISDEASPLGLVERCVTHANPALSSMAIRVGRRRYRSRSRAMCFAKSSARPAARADFAAFLRIRTPSEYARRSAVSRTSSAKA